MQGRISPRCATLCTDENEAALKRVVDFCRTYGVAKLGLQLAHAGRKGSQQPPAEGGKPLTAEQGAWVTQAPSAIAYADGWPAPHELSKDEIAQIVAEHVRRSGARRTDRLRCDQKCTAAMVIWYISFSRPCRTSATMNTVARWKIVCAFPSRPSLPCVRRGRRTSRWASGCRPRIGSMAAGNRMTWSCWPNS